MNHLKLNKKISNSINYIDLFCGVGGFSKGFDDSGFKNVFSNDCEKDYCLTYEANFPSHKLIQKKIEDLSTKEIADFTQSKNVDVIIGGPPCQGFSIAGNIGRKFIDDPRNSLFKEFIRVVGIVKPNFIVMENVQRLFTHNKNKTKNEIINKLNKIGYHVECRVLNSVDFLVPQMRRRTIFIGSKITKNIKFPEKGSNEILTIRDAIHDLPKLKSGQTSKIKNHIAMNHSDQMLKKMKFVKDGAGRETIPINLRPKTGDIRKYIKYNSSKPSICITGDMRKVFHYSQNRALTVRELARVQTFPDSFIFKGSTISQQQQIGNAVPPKMAKFIAQSVKSMIYNAIKKAS
jgi:DNA (cytosine-5)-methyltransferase 1